MRTGGEHTGNKGDSRSETATVGYMVNQLLASKAADTASWSMLVVVAMAMLQVHASCRCLLPQAIGLFLYSLACALPLLLTDHACCCTIAV